MQAICPRGSIASAAMDRAATTSRPSANPRVTTAEIRASIVNPRLSADREMEVCLQCLETNFHRATATLHREIRPGAVLLSARRAAGQF